MSTSGSVEAAKHSIDDEAPLTYVYIRSYLCRNRLPDICISDLDEPECV